MKSAARTSDERHLDFNAVLCTDSQTYQIRQVHSSNSVFVAEPSETQSGDDSNLISSPGLCAIAQCTATLELLPSSASAVSFLRQKLPPYTGPGHVTDRDASPANATQEIVLSRESVFDNAPYSLVELKSAWKHICAFEMKQISLRPTPLALIEVWNSMMSAVLLRNINVEDAFAVDMLLGPVEEEGHPASLVRTVMSRLALPGTGQTEDGRSF